MPDPILKITPEFPAAPAVPAYAQFLESILPSCLPQDLVIDPASLRHLGTGGENFVFKASSELYGPVTIRIPSNEASHLRSATHEHRVMRSDREFEYLALAASSGAKVPMPLRTGTLSDDPAGHSFVVCSWIEGRPWNRATDNTPEFWASVAAEVAKLHAMPVSSEFMNPWNKSSPRDWPTFVRQLQGPWVSERALEKGVITAGEAAAVEERLVSLMQVKGPKTLNHGDLHTGNILVSGDGGCAGLIDLGLVRILNGPWEDLARIRATIGHETESTEHFERLLGAFRQGYSASMFDRVAPIVDGFEIGHLCSFLTWDSTVLGSDKAQRALMRLRTLLSSTSPT